MPIDFALFNSAIFPDTSVTCLGFTVMLGYFLKKVSEGSIEIGVYKLNSFGSTINPGNISQSPLLWLTTCLSVVKFKKSLYCLDPALRLRFPFLSKVRKWASIFLKNSGCLGVVFIFNLLSTVYPILSNKLFP
jgi:hypothetical protein